MSIFDRLFGKRVEILDPELGTLRFAHGRWHGTLSISDEDVAFDIGGTKEAPSEDHRDSLLTIRDRFPSLRTRIGNDLVELHRQYVINIGDLAPPDFPQPSTPDEVLEVLVFTGISIDKDGRPTLLFTYRDLEDDEMFETTVDGDKLSSEYIGD